MKKFINNMINKIKHFDYKKFIKDNILLVIFVLSSLINSMLLRFLTVQNFFDIQPILCDLSLIILISSFSFLFKPKTRFKYFLVFSCLFTFICIVNSMYYTNYLSYASISLLATSFQIIDVADAVVDNVMEIKDFCYIWQIFAVIFAYYSLIKKDYYKTIKKVNNKKYFVDFIIIGLIVLGIFLITLSPTDIGRITKQWNRDYIVSKYGIFAYQLSDIVFSVTPKITSMFGYDSNYKLFRDYYSNKEISQKNDYSNIFEGKNVLVIHAESIQQFTMDTSFNGVEVTPNLNKLASSGIYFSNFYAQESVGTSSDSEFTFSTSLLPSTSGTIAINYWDREYVTIQKLLKEEGYYTFSMHGNNCNFWNRNLLHQQFGYEKFYCYTNDYEIDETIGLGLSDKSFFRQSIDKIETINNQYKNWYGTLIMLTNHTPFSYIEGHTDYAVDYKYEKIDEETGQKTIATSPYLEGTVMGDYIKSVHYADEAIGELIEGLDEKGLLDNTILVIYGDHDAKIKTSEYEKYYNYDYINDTVLDSNDPNYVEVSSLDYELNRKVPFIIWSKDMANKYKKEVTEVMGMYDVLPTLGNMLNIDNIYSLGNDIFSVDKNMVVFPDASWITNEIYYNSQKNEAYSLNKADMGINILEKADYIDENNELAEKKIVVSNSISVYDLIKQIKEDKINFNN